ncbi:transglycosylase family protein [Streptomyces sp. NPDC093065]|uniref:transglycosylase family protein n=1 Tax=Streptomyces sp. NPDC093065 TaxID=3366021 RepID=UPI0038229B35
MLSGNGRHRRPRQAPALVVAAGVTGSAIAIPLLGATGAHAAGSANWDQVAECETGGAWSQNSGNGYYGGLQLSQEAWERYGGLDYAPSADQASRSQQIRIAEKIHADQGIAAWPTCGLLAGLGNDSGGTSGGSGATGDGASEGSDTSGKTDTPKSSESPDSSQSADSGDSSGATETPEATSGEPSSSPSSSSSPSASPSSDASSDASGDSRGGADQSVKPDASAESGSSGSAEPQGVEGSSGSGKHRGGSAEEGATEEGRTDATTGRHASRDGDEGEAEVGRYVVRTGDSLWAIADTLEVTGGWHTLYADNTTVVGADPDHILPGQTLTVTGESGEK